MNTAKIAETFGMVHFAKGGDCIPYQCKDLRDILVGLKVGQGEPLLKAFIRGWMTACLADV